MILVRYPQISHKESQLTIQLLSLTLQRLIMIQQMNLQSVSLPSSTGEADWIISLRRGIKPRNPQHITKNCETCGSNVHTISDHNNIEWFRKREALQAKKVESFKASKTESLSALRSKTPTKSKNSNGTPEGFHLANKVVDLVSSRGLTWPQSWLTKALALSLLTVPALDPHIADVDWFRIVWFSHNIPRHAFHLWLVMRNGLKTHDKMRQWDVGSNTDLNLLRCMEVVPPILQDIISYLQPMGNKRTAKSVFGKLILASSAYFIWMERNHRTFKNTRRSLEEVQDLIITLRFKDTSMVKQLLDKWKMPTNFRLYGN
ncbi:zinc finger, CCHC-type containing protein [Tanacetum coccineum]